ncbi:hypothetical protein AAGQ96_11185 [Pantoea sp. MBD-2R]|uniref:hypothetical protein n=1 Tax=unclassified Pantoea TaxID=2630326 RepID=UPI0011BFAD22|nr:hypothetical protein [Pantoea sp. CCBC3-3-1]
MVKVCALLCLSLLLTGCALKRYPASPPVSAVQKTTLDCPAVEKAIASQQEIQAQIDKTGKFDGLTVLGFIGDFGIGNGVAKGLAQKHANERMSELKKLEAAKCPATLHS